MPAPTATIQGDFGAAALLGRIELALENPIVPYGVAAAYITELTERRFAEGGDPAWEDITPKSRAARKGDQSAPPLTDLGMLRRSLTTMVPGVPYALFEIGINGLTIGTDAPGAPALQYGYEPHNLPERQYLYLTDQNEAEMMERIQASFSTIFLGVP